MLSSSAKRFSLTAKILLIQTHHRSTFQFQERNGLVPDINEDELREIFREFDLNGDGYIVMDELRSVMIKMGQSPTEEELAAMFKAADVDNDGKIEFKGRKNTAPRKAGR